ncbi:cation:proton antiporter [Streptomyces parvus]|uniref:cation:proton antiporter n=1 Tax=Streptomyces parvus TaxID=66428 RepID=UPI0035D98172
MNLLNLLLLLAHVAVALGVVLLVALAGRTVARLLRQPEVIGEIVAGLLSGPAAIAVLGRGTFDAMLPDRVFGMIELIAQAGLVLFLVGLAHSLGSGPSGPARRATAWVAAGSLLPTLLTGALLAGWVLLTDDAAARGDAPLASFLLMVMVSMSITAVPVLARILTDRGMSGSEAGRLAMSAAIVIDAVGWLLLTLAISLGTGDVAGLLHSGQALALGVLCALAIRFGARTGPARRLCVRLPRTAGLLLGGTTLGVALSMEHLGMTAILGAALVGFAVPAGGEDAHWGRAVRTVSRSGRALAPAFFVVTGITVLSGAFADASWTLICGTVALGCAGKLLGGYAGARMARQPRGTALRIGVLMNTRGLTELIVLQAGYSAGILTAPLVLALIVMALATTALTGPLLDLLDRVGPPLPAGKVSVATATESSVR